MALTCPACSAALPGFTTEETLKQRLAEQKAAHSTVMGDLSTKAAAAEAGVPCCGGNISAMFGFFLCEGPVHNFEQAKAADTARFGRLHRAMLERGMYLAPSAFEAGFTSLAHSDADIDATIAAFRDVFATVA
jgi:glutamate-1-semialdehyde 2,1-aminomutase